MPNIKTCLELAQLTEELAETIKHQAQTIKELTEELMHIKNIEKLTKP